MRTRVVCLLLAAVAGALPISGCAGPTARGPEPARDLSMAFPDVLSHRGVPRAVEDWSFAPFSDQGAWFGFALPPEERVELRGGFSGPFLMTRGRWVAPELIRLVLEEEEGEVRFDETSEYESAALPGRLVQHLRAAGLELTLELWFDSASTAIVRARIGNVGETPRSVRLNWIGSTFVKEVTLEFAGSGVVARSREGDALRIDVDRPPAVVATGDGRYGLPLADPIALGPGEATDVAVAMRWVLEGDPPPAVADGILEPASVEASYSRNRARWNGYLAAIDAGRDATDPRRILGVKSLLTLVNNWRGPAGRLNHSGLFPSSNVWYFNGFWAWDSWKHAVALSRFDVDLAKEQVRAMFEHQDETGMVADVVYLDPKEDNWRDSKPPLASWAVEAVFDASGDTDFVEEIYPKLVAYHEFWYAARDHDRDGLCEYGSTDGTLEAARWESGMDNAVRFDATRMLQNGPRSWSMNQASVDLNSYLYREKRTLQKLADVLGLADESRRWAEQADELRARIREAMFDEETGWFHDIDIDSGAIVPAQGPEGWIPLWSGVATEQQAARVRETMLDPAKFRTHVPFPTVSRDNPAFSDGYWRGLVWLDQAYFGIEGLRRYGYREDADALTAQLFANLEGATTPGLPLFENYSPLTGEGQNVKHFSWTAAHLLLLSLDSD